MIFPQSVPDDGLNTKNDEAGPSDSNPSLNSPVQSLQVKELTESVDKQSIN